MKQFIAFFIKEWRHILRDRKTLLILFGMPLAQITLFGFALNNEIKEARTGIFNQSGDLLTQTISSRINASDYFKITSHFTNEASMEESFRNGSIRLCIIFPKNFSRDYYNGMNPGIKIISDASDPNQASTLSAYAGAVVNSALRKPGDPIPVVQIKQRLLYNPGLKAVYMFVPGVMALIMMLVSAMMTSITIAKEKETGTMELLVVSPLKPGHIILGKVTPYWILSFIICSMIIMMGLFVFDMPLNGSLILLILSCLLFILTALSLGIIISGIADSQMTALMISLMGLLLPTLLLSGFIFPVESMPVPLQIVSHIIPAKWFIILIKGIMIKGSGLKILWQPFLILSGITLTFLLIAFRKLSSKSATK
jgi:ABC-2 type transport system permease protein